MGNREHHWSLPILNCRIPYIAESEKVRSFNIRWNSKHQKFQLSGGYPINAHLPTSTDDISRQSPWVWDSQAGVVGATSQIHYGRNRKRSPLCSSEPFLLRTKTHYEHGTLLGQAPTSWPVTPQRLLILVTLPAPRWGGQAGVRL